MQTSRGRGPLQRSGFRRAATYAASLLLALFFVSRFFEFLRLRGSLPAQTLYHIFLAVGLRLSALSVFVALPWAILHVCYFGYKLVSTLSEQTAD